MVKDMKKKLVLLGAALLLSSATASAQSRVTGRVTDSNGQPVMGATVRIPGTKIVTTTDAKGTFKLNVPAGAKKLVVSYIGMQAETVSVAGNVQVVLKDNELGEAVVVGYGTARKIGTVVGSVKKVGSEQVSDKPAPNVADALQGKVAGLQIFSNSGDAGEMGDMSITLRGVGSLGAGSEPLVVVDGAPASAAVLALLNDRTREPFNNRYITPGLDALIDVQRTSDIFFPGYWLGSLLRGHRSSEAAEMVKDFVRQHPGYPQKLMNKLNENAFWLLNR